MGYNLPATPLGAGGMGSRSRGATPDRFFMATSSPEPSGARLPDRYRVLLDIGHSLTGTLSLRELYRAIHRETARVIEATGFYIALYDGEDDSATVVFYVDQGEHQEASIRYRGSDSKVIRTGRGCIVEDRLQSQSLLVLGDNGSEVTRSAVSAPLRYKGSVVGAISAQSYRPNAYGEDDLELLQGIADIAAVATENARYVSELQQRRREAERIEEIGRALASSRETGVVLDTIIEAALDLLEAQGASVWLTEGEGEARIAASSGPLALPKGARFRLSGPVVEQIVQQRRPVRIDDVPASDLLPEPLKKRVRARSALVVPLVGARRVTGALSVGVAERRGFREADAQLLQRLANHAAVALENARLHADLQELSLTDPLTGLPNRRHLEIHLGRELAAAKRGRKLVVVLFDLDNFKQYNDTLGHLAGDEALRLTGRMLAEETRAMNLAARFGGDEFISVLSDATVAGGRYHADRVQARVAEAPTFAEHGVTVSYGVAAFEPTMESGEDLIRAADRDMYRNKADGRGTVDEPPPDSDREGRGRS